MKNPASKNWTFVLLTISVVTSILVVSWPAPVTSGNAGFAVFLGRFHPLVLHFPIVFVLLATGGEVCSFFRQKPFALQVLFLNLSLASALVAVCCGFLLYQSGEYRGGLVENHLWGGAILLLSLSIATALFLWAAKAATLWVLNLYRVGLLVASAATIYTGHVGGSITHGPEFLTEYAPKLSQVPKTPIESKKQEDLLVFEDLIVPILEKRCYNCHNEHRSKGDLLMTSLADILKGGKSQKLLVVAGHPDSSELYHRITLPANDEERMPPPEKTGLSDEEIFLLRWWIEEGAKPEITLGQGPADTVGRQIIQRYLPKLYQSQRQKALRRKEREKMAGVLANLAEKLELVIQPDLYSEHGYFAVSMQLPPSANVTDVTIDQLMPYADQISKISLPASDITDDAMYNIGRMPHLRELLLPRTAIKGDGLVYLKDLKELETLNLSYTLLSGEKALHLIQLPQLKEVFLFNTQADSAVIGALKGYLPKLKVLEEEGPYY